MVSPLVLKCILLSCWLLPSINFSELCWHLILTTELLREGEKIASKLTRLLLLEINETIRKYGFFEIVTVTGNVHFLFCLECCYSRTGCVEVNAGKFVSQVINHFPEAGLLDSKTHKICPCLVIILYQHAQ